MHRSYQSPILTAQCCRAKADCCITSPSPLVARSTWPPPRIGAYVSVRDFTCTHERFLVGPVHTPHLRCNGLNAIYSPANVSDSLFSLFPRSAAQSSSYKNIVHGHCRARNLRYRHTCIKIANVTVRLPAQILTHPLCYRMRILRSSTQDLWQTPYTDPHKDGIHTRTFVYDFESACINAVWIFGKKTFNFSYIRRC